MDVKNIPLDDIVPYAKNAKKHDKTQIKNVAESIKQYGFVQPIVVDRDGVIVIGHCRALAAKKLGMEEVPCVCVDDLTPEQVNALRLVDNKSAEDGASWDLDLLAEELPELDLSAFDFDWGIENEYEYGTDFSLRWRSTSNSSAGKSLKGRCFDISILLTKHIETGLPFLSFRFPK